MGGPHHDLDLKASGLIKNKMDPEIWGKLPWDLIRRVAHFADIDARRALGFKPRRLPKSDFVPRPIAPTTWRYFTALKKLLYINFDESYDLFMWEVFEDIKPEGDVWFQGRHGMHRGVWRGPDDFVYFDTRAPRCPMHFAGQPEIIV
jgi:hypothetical protein